MSRYVVLCDCDGDPDPRIVAWIDDERPAGPVRTRSNTAFSAIHKFDGTITTSIRCRACKRLVAWSEATAADVIDKVAPARDTLEVRSIRALDEPLAQTRYVIPFQLLCEVVRRLRERDASSQDAREI